MGHPCAARKRGLRGRRGWLEVGYMSGMNCMTKIRALAALLLMAASLPAEAATVQSTQFSTYPVTGRTPAEIYRAILKRGPTVGGNKAIAATTSEAVQKHLLAQGASSCRVSEFRLNFRFNVQLPRHTNPSVLSSSDRYLWQQFTGFLKVHELQHTKLWLHCGALLERRVLAIRAPTCDAVERRAEAIWRRLKPSCDQKQVNFDSQQRDELLSHPFMQAVMHGQ